MDLKASEEDVNVKTSGLYERVSSDCLQIAETHETVTVDLECAIKILEDDFLGAAVVNYCLHSP